MEKTKKLQTTTLLLFQNVFGEGKHTQKWTQLKAQNFFAVSKASRLAVKTVGHLSNSLASFLVSGTFVFCNLLSSYLSFLF